MKQNLRQDSSTILNPYSQFSKFVTTSLIIKGFSKKKKSGFRFGEVLLRTDLCVCIYVGSLF